MIYDKNKTMLIIRPIMHHTFKHLWKYMQTWKENNLV